MHTTLSSELCVAEACNEKVPSAFFRADVFLEPDKVSNLNKEKMLEIAAKEELSRALKQTQNNLTFEEKQRLTQLAIAKKLREKLENSSAELTAMSLVLEEQRKRAAERAKVVDYANFSG